MVERHREQWATRGGFLLAAIGSAIGLGNIWRFPYIAYESGGGAFIVPYLVALITAGLPLLILSYTIGQRYQGSPPVALGRMARPAEAIGWWQVGISFVIAIYYAVIVAWAVRFTGFSIDQRWGGNPNEFLHEEFLRSGDSVGAPTSYIADVAWPLVAVWVVTLGVLAFGVRRGIERANKVFVPLLVVMFGALVVRALTLDGAATGLDALFTPDWSAIADGGVWVAAYGQIFFSLSVGFGIMITYASYLRRRADLSGSALVAGFANSSFEILAGIGVFATLGFMAAQQGTGIDRIATHGIGLAFIAFPEIISNMPLGSVFGVLFFGSLVVAGLSSLVSIVQVVVAAVQDRTGARRLPVVLGVGGATATISILLFPSDQGVALLDVTDRFINQYGIALVALVLVVTVAWLLRNLPMLQEHADANSAVSLGRRGVIPLGPKSGTAPRFTGWWQICLGVVTPLVLGWMMVDSLLTEFTENYEGYPTWFLVSVGGGVAVGVIALAAVLTLLFRDRGATSPAGGKRDLTGKGSR